MMFTYLKLSAGRICQLCNSDIEDEFDLFITCTQIKKTIVFAIHYFSVLFECENF